MKTLSAVIQLTHQSPVKAYTDFPLEASGYGAQLVPSPWPGSGVFLQQYFCFPARLIFIPMGGVPVHLHVQWHLAEM